VVAARRFAVLNPATWPGTRFDWGFSALAALLVCAGFVDSWQIRHPPVHLWSHAASQGAWLLVTLLVAAVGTRNWLRSRSLEQIVPEGYEMSAVGCVVFAIGMLIGFWWQIALGQDQIAVPAVFRPPNLIQITGAGLIVTGPLRAAIARGELLAGPTAVVSATLLLATVSFFTQFDSPYVDQWATNVHGLPTDKFGFIGELLGVLSLMLQAAAVVGVVLLVLRQIRLPVGSITFMLTVTALLLCTQMGNFDFVVVAAVVGALSDLLLYWARPRSDRLMHLRVFAAGTGALLAAVYLLAVALRAGTYWPPDVVFGSILVCGVIAWLISFMTFPEREVAKAAAVLWPILEQDSSPSAPDITVDRLDHALRVFNNLRDLAESPLASMRCLPNHSGPALRQLMEDAISALRASSAQVDAQAGEILYLYYVRHIGGHYAVMLRVGLSRAAYFNRRSYGVRRLVDRLKELEEQATPA
jgi:hypothetical protein